MNTQILYRCLALLIGYAFGNFLTAEVVTRKLTGKPCKDLGTSGNPGMANVMAHLGFVPGITVLIGDLAKCIIACAVSWILFGSTVGRIVILYAGLGATLGHDFPVWQKFKGGKGVAVSCLAIFIFSPLWGLLANIVGMLVTFATKYLSVGGAVLPASFVIPMFIFFGPEAGVVSLVLALVCVYKHYPQLRLIPSGKAEQVDVLAAIKKKLGKSEASEEN